MTRLFFENVSETITYSGSGWMLANFFHQGFFRTLYDDDTNDEILSQLKNESHGRFFNNTYNKNETMNTFHKFSEKLFT